MDKKRLVSRKSTLGHVNSRKVCTVEVVCKMSKIVHSSGVGGLNWANLVHVVVECPLMRLVAEMRCIKALLQTSLLNPKKGLFTCAPPFKHPLGHAITSTKS